MLIIVANCVCRESNIYEKVQIVLIDKCIGDSIVLQFSD